MAFNETLAQRIRDTLARKKGVEEKEMFGGIGFLLHGNMLVGVWKNSLIVRVGPEDYEDALLEPHVKEFDITGRAMKGWVLAMAMTAGVQAGMAAVTVTKSDFGKMPDGTAVSAYTLKDADLEVKITTYGARITSLLTKDKKWIRNSVPQKCRCGSIHAKNGARSSSKPGGSKETISTILRCMA